MDKTLLLDLLKSLKFEAIRFRTWVVLLFIAAAFAALVVGYLWPNSYRSEAVLYADRSNIIEPLLKGRASVTGVDHAKQAQDVLYSNRVMEKAAIQAGLVDESASDDRKAQMVRHLRGAVRVDTQGNNQFKVSYSSNDPDRTFTVVNSVVNVFIQDTARRKREESVSAFNFIDAQVDSYRRQLEEAEERLKEFRAQNTDGTESQVNSRINSLRNDIESLKLEIEDSESRLNTIEQQLNQENQYQLTKGKVDKLRERRDQLNRELEQLRMSYQESYPDIVSLKQQIQDIDEEIARIEFGGESFSGGGEKVENPLYEDLRKQQSRARVDLNAQRRRLENLKQMLDSELERAERVAANQAELSELTRDLDVIRKVYNEMLERKESARLSMALDVEGQGVSYRIQDPASFPLSPTGLRFVHFAAAGPFLGFMAPIGLLVLFLLLDPHIRSAHSLRQQLPEDIPLMGVIPHYHTPIAARLLRKDMVLLVSFSLLAMAAYVGLSIHWYDLKN